MEGGMNLQSRWQFQADDTGIDDFVHGVWANAPWGELLRRSLQEEVPGRELLTYLVLRGYGAVLVCQPLILEGSPNQGCLCLPPVGRTVHSNHRITCCLEHLLLHPPLRSSDHTDGRQDHLLS